MNPQIPLAEILRPKNADEYIGQQHLMSEGNAFRLMLDGGKVHSMIFWGPPGVGKTTLASDSGQCHVTTLLFAQCC